MAVERVRFLDSGSLVIDRSHVMWNIDAGNPVRFPVYSVLIEHSDGLFLFDSGFDKGTVEEFLAFELPEQTEEQTIPAQLEKCGFTPGDVTAVINSHLHFDHVGGQRHLPDAVTWVAQGGPAPRPGAGAVRAARLRGQGLSPPGLRLSVAGRRGVRLRRRDQAPAHARPHGRPLLAAARLRREPRRCCFPPTSPTRARPGRRS